MSTSSAPAGAADREDVGGTSAASHPAGATTFSQITDGLDLLAQILNPRGYVAAQRPDTRTILVREDGNASTWSEIRAVVLDRDNYECQECHGEANEVDHIWPRAWDGRDYIENLRAICSPCNKTKGASLDFMAAPFGDIAGGFDVVDRRLCALLNDYIAPALTEMAERGRHDEYLPDERPNLVLDAVASQFERWASAVADLIRTTRTAVNGGAE